MFFNFDLTAYPQWVQGNTVQVPLPFIPPLGSAVEASEGAEEGGKRERWC